MKLTPILKDFFYHDGRGPELQKIHWRGAYPEAFEFYNPDDSYDHASLKHLTLQRVEAYSMAGDEVHGNIVASGESSAAITLIENSEWLSSHNSTHLSECNHYQIMFYDEIFDVICKDIQFGVGKYTPAA